MTRVGILSEPASLRRAVHRSLEREAGFVVVPAMVSGGAGLVGPDVLVVSVDPAVNGRADELGLAWNARRTPRVVLMDVTGIGEEVAPTAEVDLTPASRRELARAVRAARRAEGACAPRVRPRLEALAAPREATITPLRGRAPAAPLLSRLAAG